MRTPTRRSFLTVGGAGLAAAALAPRAGAATIAAPPGPAGTIAAGPVVAYLPDPGSGQVCVMRGEREVLVRDHRLAALIAAVLG